MKLDSFAGRRKKNVVSRNSPLKINVKTLAVRLLFCEVDTRHGFCPMVFRLVFDTILK